MVQVLKTSIVKSKIFFRRNLELSKSEENTHTKQ